MSKLLTIDSKISREGIQCDGPDCGQYNPEKRCSRCHTTFYCSVACQKNDWAREHKQYCRPIDEMRRKATEPEGIVASVDEPVLVGTNTGCCICMEDPIQNPVVLKDCHHAFCGPCLITWQSKSRDRLNTLGGGAQKSPVCPICRTNTDNVEDVILATARLSFARALQCGSSENDRQHHLELAIQEVDKALQNPETNDKVVSMKIFILKAELLIKAEKGQAALECLDEMERINQIRTEEMGPFYDRIAAAEAAIAAGAPNAEELMEEVVTLYEDKQPSTNVLANTPETKAGIQLFRADAYKSIHEWAKAKDCYQAVLVETVDPDDVTPIQMREIFMGLAECAFKLQVYDRAIAATDAALEFNRHFPGVYKYKALSQKALGKLEEAIQTMKVAAIYETPWDDANRQKVIDLHNQLVEEQEQQEAKEDG